MELPTVDEKFAETPAHIAIMRRVALFLDGMARAIILPFGPSLVYRLVSSGDAQHPSWAHAFYFSLLVSVYIVGRWMGTSLVLRYETTTTLASSASSSDEQQQRLGIYVARLGGSLLSLHIFTYGAGLSSVAVLLVIRFLSATLAGVLCGITRSIKLPEDDRLYFSDSLDEEKIEATRRREGYVDIASGTAKIYLTGFAVSILSGGLLFRQATKDSTFQALTGAYQYSWSPMFLISVAVSAEIVLRKIFAWVEANSPTETEDSSITTTSLAPKIVFSSSGGGGRFPFSPDSINEAEFLDTLGDQSVRSFSTPSRSRHNSYNSVDDFYDCRSVFSETESSLQQWASSEDVDETEIARYVDGRCVYANGNSAHVPPGDSIAVVPTNYLKFCKQKSKAKKAWEATQAWRRENDVWRIHRMPHKWFAPIKEAYPHFVHGHSKAGYPVVYEQPGKMNLKALFKSDCDIADMARHYVYFMEYLANRVSTLEEVRAGLGTDAPDHSSSTWGSMVVMDVKGAGLSHLSGDVLRYLKTAGDTNSKHYPLTMKRAFVVNSPFWLAGAWSKMKGILPESVQVEFLSSNMTNLKDYIDEDQIPPEYGGTSPYNLGEHPYEIELEQLVEANKNAPIDDEQSLDLGTPKRKSPRERVVDVERALPLIQSPPSSHQMRRRVYSSDRTSRLQSLGVGSYNANKDFSGHQEVFIIVSAFYCMWSVIQGAIEALIPLWILSPTIVGGLGYSPLRSGVTMFCACLALLWALRTKPSRLVSRIPSKGPLRALRIGAGAESALLGLLVCVSTSTSPHKRTDSVFVMASTIVVFSCIALASMLGRSGSKILHRIAAEGFAQNVSPSRSSIFGYGYYGMSRFLADCGTGRLTTFLNIASELFGSVFFATLWSWSVASNHRPPWDGTFIFLLSSVSTFLLYVCSFSLHLNSAGEFAPHPKENSNSTLRRFCLFLREIVAVSAGDMASLFEERNWANSRRRRSRSSSEASAHVVEFMESCTSPPHDKAF